MNNTKKIYPLTFWDRLKIELFFYFIFVAYSIVLNNKPHYDSSFIICHVYDNNGKNTKYTILI